MVKLANPRSPPPEPALHRSKMSCTSDLGKDYWLKLCPELHVNDKRFQKATIRNEAFRKKDSQAWLEQVNSEGYVCLPPHVENGEQSLLPDGVDANVLSKCVVRLMQYGWPPSFISMYDEAWAIINRVNPLMDTVTGNNVNMDILTWYIDPNHDDDRGEPQAGFAPHRDRQPDDSPASFRKDGTAKYTTCWMALTNATPENSCLYMIPRWADPGYYDGDLDDTKHPMFLAVPDKESFQNIRAMPTPPGGAVFFTHRIIHWGSRGRKGYPEPRIAFSFAASEDSFEPSYFSRDHLPFPSVALRLSLNGGQMVAYQDRFRFPRGELKFYHSLYKMQMDSFHQTYKAKVATEFMKMTQSGAHEDSLWGVTDEKKVRDSVPKDHLPSDDDEDDIDAALDHILDAADIETGGNAPQDDFDVEFGEELDAGGDMSDSDAEGDGDNNVWKAGESASGEGMGMDMMWKWAEARMAQEKSERKNGKDKSGIETTIKKKKNKKKKKKTL